VVLLQLTLLAPQSDGAGRKIALLLASGETMSAAAKKFGVSLGRVSQLRKWLRENWLAFQREATAEEQPQLAVA
jgi:hypothetical protein